MHRAPSALHTPRDARGVHLGKSAGSCCSRWGTLRGAPGAQGQHGQDAAGSLGSTLPQAASQLSHAWLQPWQCPKPCPCEEQCRERKKSAARQEKGESRRCGREAWCTLKARSHCAFVCPRRDRRCCQRGGAVPAPWLLAWCGQASRCYGSLPGASAGDVPRAGCGPCRAFGGDPHHLEPHHPEPHHPGPHCPEPHLLGAHRPSGARPWGGQHSRTNNTGAKIIASDRSISSARFKA